MYILLDTDKECGLLYDRPLLSTGRKPHDIQNRNCLDYNQNLVMNPGVAQCADVSFKVNLTLILDFQSCAAIVLIGS
jgi:hypothetical protein